jgi:hypothetical protein
MQRSHGKLRHLESSIKKEQECLYRLLQKRKSLEEAKQ